MFSTDTLRYHKFWQQNSNLNKTVVDVIRSILLYLQTQ